MKKIVFASNNAGKVREVNQILSATGIEVISQSEFDVPEIEETGLTFVENAILKARNAAHYAKLPALADDSGLEVDALKGAPGIYSARYSGVDASDAQNVEKLLTALDDMLLPQRSARFQCLMVLMRHELDPTPIICQGTWEGSITTSAQGENGFGYDPIFYYAQEECTAAQLPSEVKNKLSHRGQALKKLLEQINAFDSE